MIATLFLVSMRGWLTEAISQLAQKWGKTVSEDQVTPWRRGFIAVFWLLVYAGFLLHNFNMAHVALIGVTILAVIAAWSTRKKRPVVAFLILVTPALWSSWVIGFTFLIICGLFALLFLPRFWEENDEIRGLHKSMLRYVLGFGLSIVLALSYSPADLNKSLTFGSTTDQTTASAKQQPATSEADVDAPPMRFKATETFPVTIIVDGKSVGVAMESKEDTSDAPISAANAANRSFGRPAVNGIGHDQISSWQPILNRGGSNAAYKKCLQKDGIEWDKGPVNVTNLAKGKAIVAILAVDSNVDANSIRRQVKQWEDPSLPDDTPIIHANKEPTFRGPGLDEAAKVACNPWVDTQRKWAKVLVNTTDIAGPAIRGVESFSKNPFALVNVDGQPLVITVEK